MAGMVSSGFAATLLWDADGVFGAPKGGTGIWNTSAALWDNGTSLVAWSSPNVASFGGTAGIVTVDAGGISAEQIQFTTTGYTLSGGPLTLTAASNDAVVVNAGITATVNSNLSKSAGEFWLRGGGTLVLGGTNTINPSLVITGGSTLEIGNMAALGGTGGLFFTGATAGNTLRYTGGDASLTRLNGTFGLTASSATTFEVTNAATTMTIAQNLADNGGATAFTKAGAGRILLTGASTFTGATTITNGTLTLGSAASFGGGNYGGAITNQGALNFSSTAFQNFTGVFSGAGQFTQTSGVVTLSNGANSFSGKYAISGTNTRFGVGSDAAFGAVPSSFVADYLTLGAGTIFLNMTQATNNAGGFNVGFDLNLHANRGILLTGNTTLQVGYGKTVTINGAISGTGSITHTDGGTLSLKGANSFNGNITNTVGTLALGGTGNTYTGYTHITGGSTLRLDTDNTLPDSTTVLLYGGTTFNVNGKTDTLGALTTGSSVDTTATINLGAGGNLVVTNNGLPAGLTAGYVNATVAAKITGTGNIEYAHASSDTALWDISNGAHTNDFTGNWTITRGRLRFLPNAGADTALGNAGNDLFFNGGVVDTLGNGQGKASIQVTNGTSMALNAGRTVTLNAGKEGTFYTWSGTTFTVNGQITGGGHLRKEDGGILLLNNPANDYAGETKVVSGALLLGANEVLPNTTLLRVGTSDAGSPTLNLNGKTETVAGLSSVQVSNSAVLTNGIVTSGNLLIAGSGNHEYGGAFNSGTLTMNGSGSQTLSGSIDNAGGMAVVNSGTLNLAKSSTATVHAIGAESSVGLTINGGTAKLGGTGGDQIYTNTRVAMTGGVFDLNERSEGFQSLQGSGGVVTNSGGAASTLTLGEGSVSGNTFTFSGSIQNGVSSVALTKVGAGKQVLTGTNSFTGVTTISGGTLEAGATGALGGIGTVTINTGGTLLLSGAGTDRINDAAAIRLQGGTIAFSGNITEGSSPGTGALTLTANSVIDFAGGDIVINFGASDLAAWTSGTTLSIYNWGGSALGGGNDRLLFGSTSGTLTSAQLAQISFYDGGAGSNFLGFGSFVGSVGEIVPVPEPSSAALAFGLTAMAGWRERRLARASLRASRLAHASSPAA